MDNSTYSANMDLIAEKINEALRSENLSAGDLQTLATANQINNLTPGGFAESGGCCKT